MQTEIKLFRWFQSVAQDKNSDKRSSKALRKKWRIKRQQFSTLNKLEQ